MQIDVNLASGAEDTSDGYMQISQQSFTATIIRQGMKIILLNKYEFIYNWIIQLLKYLGRFCGSPICGVHGKRQMIHKGEVSWEEELSSDETHSFSV